MEQLNISTSQKLFIDCETDLHPAYAAHRAATTPDAGRR